MRRLYTAYNLVIESDIALPELVELENGAPSTADVIVRFGSASKDSLVDGRRVDYDLWADRSGIWLDIGTVARFLVQNGNRIWIEPYPEATEDSLRLFLLGSAFGAVLSQRDFLVLHGNAIRIGDQCMVCVGDSGAGKSTLAAGFMQRGFDVLADDVVPVDDQCRAIPGFPRIKLWQHAADQLNIDTSGLRRIRSDLDKYNLPVRHSFETKPVPIRWIYVLRNDEIEGVRFERIKGLDRFEPLLDNTYRFNFVEGMALTKAHLQRCGQLAGKIHLSRVTRARDGFALDELVDRLLLDMEEHP